MGILHCASFPVLPGLPTPQRASAGSIDNQMQLVSVEPMAPLSAVNQGRTRCGGEMMPRVHTATSFPELGGEGVRGEGSLTSPL